jgi:diguanylate cyclase (GGDEF)-like protein/PAS domain S-box-containing protein
LLISGPTISNSRPATEPLGWSPRLPGFLLLPGDGLILLDGEGRICWLDRWVKRLLGGPVASWSGQPLAACWPALDQAVQEHAARLAEGPVDLERPGPRGELRGIRLFRSDTGVGIGVLQTGDASPIDHPLVQLFSGLFNAVQDALLITLAEPINSPGPVIVYANASLSEQTGYAPHELLGRSPRLFQGPGTDLSVTGRFREHLRQWHHCEMEVLNYSRDGQPIWIDLKVAPLADADGWFTHWVSVQRDVSDRKAGEQQLVQQAVSDPLTGLPNRRGLLEQLERALLRQPHHIALIFCDLDQFKEVNDRYGHAVGDTLLQEITRRMRAVLRPQDTMARLGGDEFVVLIDDLQHREEALGRAETLRSCLAEPWHCKGDELYLSISMGVAFSNNTEGGGPGGLSPEELLRRADLTMYEVKSRGRNGIAVYSHTSDQRVQHGVDLRHHLEQALRHDRLLLHGQPLVDLASGTVLGAEALVRLHTAAAELVSPEEFIPVAERSGLIVPVERWVMAQALRTLALWQAAGLPWQLAINISPQHLEQEQLADELLMLQEECSADLGALSVEITETVLLKAHARAHHNLSRLQQAGVTIALDDFGTGYSSLAWLSELPIDQVKIDRSIIARVTEDGRTTALVRGFVQVFQDLGLVVVAEGIETEAQHQAMLAMGCAVGQGFLYGRPTPLEQAPWAL